VSDEADRRVLLVTGATGYVGGRLARLLVDRGERVRALARRPEEAVARLPRRAEVVGGDVLERVSTSVATTASYGSTAASAAPVCIR
jgi:uncharacterized protein YbjT (DUF2867 family)